MKASSQVRSVFGSAAVATDVPSVADKKAPAPRAVHVLMPTPILALWMTACRLKDPAKSTLNATRKKLAQLAASEFYPACQVRPAHPTGA